MKTYIHNIFVFLLFIFTVSLTSSDLTAQEKEKFIVVLDAGHGGGDPGNLGNGYREKDIALKVVLEVGKALEKNKDIKVIYTRKTDVFLELYERSAIANKADADLFVSVHCNSHNSQAYGTETFVMGFTNDRRNLEIAKKENEVIFMEDNYEKHYEGFDPNSPESLHSLSLIQEQYVDQSIVLARKIEDNFSKSVGRKSRGIKQASLWVIHNTYMPGILVELGFLTNNKEGPFLNSRKGQLKMASALEDAILDYKKELDNNVGSDIFIDDDEVIIEDEVANDSTEIAEPEKPMIYEGVTFKVQIAAGKSRLATRSYNFKGLKEVSREKDGNLYKYYYGETSDYNEIQRLKEEASEKGYSSCFVVAYKAGEKVSVSEVIKSTAN
ncbi:N-acetylmuramoyl-L-alanine amidase [Winogradskyella sp. 3972H.M.0a.05]|uniref:N-acetylmuramoyl-L-alanine amidase n=1 Tax=Winogradskyella sp. 3972H.M.0a.05 TaxID=2950277 RepID=UPI00339526BA